LEQIRLKFTMINLNHTKLMTPFLIEKYGAIYVETIVEKEDEFTFSRTSIIRQTSTNNKILDAKIKVQKSSLPTMLIEQLKNTNIAFGQLLQDHQIEVNIENLQLFTPRLELTKKQRRGRRVDIVDAVSHVLICHVEEILVN